ncbi:flagellar export chaperone FliS [Desulfobulbus alkaliphilus]|uniref:flagellar export chaperone FliS n=1 Tax=Desulfobulbus alkaliphilus TaxID=869814 RepID=UPI0019634EB5|nr:flagellar export chaperone FliS [Desulfobulbus alkaliphilus]MBM9537394.1 flagellar export chaperone FliS [Desulfobulbus alkaliphilus]
MNGYTNQYVANSVNAASPEQLMLMLYDGAVRFISLAIQAIDNGQIDKRAYYINKTSAIVSEFAATLDHNQDAKLAEDLDALYSYMLGRMMEANLKNKTEPLHEVKTMLSDLRATWAQAIEINKEKKSGTAGTDTTSSGTNAYRPLVAAM